MREKVEVHPFKIIGISSSTTNADGQAVIDQPLLLHPGHPSAVASGKADRDELHPTRGLKGVEQIL